MKNKYSNSKIKTIGIFDSGLGGLTILNELKKNIPDARFIYFGDTAHLPYGSKSDDRIIEYSEKNSISKNTCIYGDMYAKEFLLNDNFKCFKKYSQLDAAKVKPLFVYQVHRNVKRSDPKDCKLIWNETYQYSFYNKNISVGKLWFCS